MRPVFLRTQSEHSLCKGCVRAYVLLQPVLHSPLPIRTTLSYCVPRKRSKFRECGFFLEWLKSAILSHPCMKGKCFYLHKVGHGAHCPYISPYCCSTHSTFPAAPKNPQLSWESHREPWAVACGKTAILWAELQPHSYGSQPLTIKYRQWPRVWSVRSRTQIFISSPTRGSQGPWRGRYGEYYAANAASSSSKVTDPRSVNANHLRFNLLYEPIRICILIVKSGCSNLY